MTQFTRHVASAQWRDHTDEEYEALKASLQRNGCTEAIHHTPACEIFDGWHRYLACGDTGVEPRFVERDLTDVQIAQWVIDHHKGRRHLPAGELAMSAVRTMRACGHEFADEQGGRPAGQEPDAPGPITRDAVTSRTGVSEGTARRAIAQVKLEESGEPDPHFRLTHPEPPRPPRTRSVRPSGPPATVAAPTGPNARPDGPQADGAADPPAGRPVSRDALAEIEKDLAYLRAENEDLTRRLALAERASDPASRELMDENARLRKLNETLKTQVAQWQTKTNEERGIARALRKRVAELEQQVAALEAGL